MYRRLLVQCSFLWSACCANGPHYGTPIYLNQFADTMLEFARINIQTGLKAFLPNTYGQCTSTAPLPCEDQGPIYKEKHYLFYVTFQWITGLRSCFIDKMAFEEITGTNEFIVSVFLRFETMELSSRIGWIWPRFMAIDNDHAFVGQNQTFGLRIQIACQSAQPHFSNPRLMESHISPPMKLCGPGSFYCFDMTDQVQRHLEKSMMRFFAADNLFVLNNGFEHLLRNYPFECTSSESVF